MKTFTTLCAAALVSTAATAAGQSSTDPGDTKEAPAAKFESLDRNSDQQLSKSEASKDKTLAAQFASIDVNTDGSISKSEYVARSSPQATSSKDRYQQPSPDQ